MFHNYVKKFSSLRQQNERFYIALTAERLNGAVRAADNVIQRVENEVVSRFFI